MIEILIGLLFILLAANLDVRSFANYGSSLLWLVIAVMLVIRPLNVWLSTWRSQLTVAEKLFLCWIAPRGIVAASMASLFALSLKQGTYPEHQAQFLETFTYSIIIATVLFQGLTAKGVGNALGVLMPKPTGWLVIGAHKFGRSIAGFIQDQGIPVVVMDSNARLINLANEEDLPTICGNALAAHPEEHPELYQIGHILAITPNEALNTLICQHWQKELIDVQIYACRGGREQEEPFDDQIWPKLPLKRLLNIEEDETLEVVGKKVIGGVVVAPEKIILCCYNNQIHLQLPEKIEGECTIFKYTQSVLAADLNLKENWVMFSEATSISQVLEELLDRLQNDYPQLPKQKLMPYFHHQEQDHTNVFGYGIALFHTYLEEVDNSLVAIARLRQPIILFDKQIQIVFLVISPMKQPQKHIETLSRLSRFIVRSDNRKQMREVRNEQELLRVFF